MLKIMLKFMSKIITSTISSLLNFDKSLLSLSNYYSKYGLIRMIMFYFNKISFKTLIKIFNYLKVFMLFFNTLFGVLIILSINDLSFAYFITTLNIQWSMQEYIQYVLDYVIPFKDNLLRKLINKLESLISKIDDKTIENIEKTNNDSDDANLYKSLDNNSLDEDGDVPPTSSNNNEKVNGWMSDHPRLKFHLINACLITVAGLALWGAQIGAEDMGYDYFYQPLFDRGYYYSMLELIRGSEYWYIRPDIITSTTPVVPDVTTSSLVSDVVTQVVEGSLETLSDSGSITPTNITRVTTPPIDEYERYFK